MVPLQPADAVMNRIEFQNLLEQGVRDGVFPGYCAAVGDRGGILLSAHGGNRALYPAALPMEEDVLFDMASLSKLMGTTMAFLRLYEQGSVSPEQTLDEFFPNCYGKEKITLHQLLTHTSGFKAHFPLWRRGITPAQAAEHILREPLGIPTGSDVVYSCMGFILLGKIMEQIMAEPLDAIVRREVFLPLGMETACYNPPADAICAATEGEICGTVHDENAAFLGGISGNAGVFASMEDCIKFAAMLARGGEGFLKPETFQKAIYNYTPGMDENRGLGFQLCSFGMGHTGFTGTSLYGNDEGRYAILLTNRVHPTRANGKLPAFRREFHKEVL